MWFFRRHRLSLLYPILSFVLLSICLYITFYDKHFTESISNKLLEITSNRENASGVYLQVLLDLTTDQPICQPDDYLLIYVLSTISNIERRKVVRSTWGSKRNGTCFIFIIGDVSGQTPNAGKIQMGINDERRRYHDIVQINHVESYANVVYKEVAALHWSRKFYPNIPYLFKTDDDLIVDTILVSLIAKLLVTNVSTINVFISQYRPMLMTNIKSADRINFFRGAWPIEISPTLRTGKFAISEDTWPSPFLPPYCSGFGWFMSKYIRDRLVKASYTYPLGKVVWIGDVFTSGFLAKAADVKCSMIPIDYDQPAEGNCSCLMFSNPLLTVCSSSFHYGTGTDEQKYNEYRKTWDIIQLRHNLIDPNITNC